VTGLNDAFVLDHERRDGLIARDARSADLLKPFLVGENLKAMACGKRRSMADLHAEEPHRYREISGNPRSSRVLPRSAGNTRNKAELVGTATSPGGMCENGFRAINVVYPKISQVPKFSVDRSPHYVSDTVFFVPRNGADLVALLGSKAMWLILFGLTSPLRGGQWRLELREQYMSRLPVPAPSTGFAALEPVAIGIQTNSEDSRMCRMAFLTRLNDVAPGAQSASFLQDRPDLSFDELRRILKKRLKVEIPVAERDEWERYFRARKAEVEGLSARIADAEAEINDRVYRLFDLDRDEIALIEEEIGGQYCNKSSRTASFVPAREAIMRSALLGIILFEAVLSAAPAVAQAPPAAPAIVRTLVAGTQLPGLAASPLYFKALSVTIPAGETSTVTAPDGILYQLSGSTEVSAGGRTKTIGPGEAMVIAGGSAASLKAGSSGPSRALHFLLAPAAALDQPVETAPASVKELYRTPAPIPGLKPGGHNLTRIAVPPQMPSNPPHHRSGAALYYLLSGNGANTLTISKTSIYLIVNEILSGIDSTQTLSQ
jgi:quercetin dioxygenase-like cupin family protein